MAYIIAEPCIGVKDGACVRVCPVDCIATTPEAEMYYIDPDGCIDCAACEPVCPVTAIFEQSALPEKWNQFVEINATWFRKRRAQLPGNWLKFDPESVGTVPEAEGVYQLQDEQRKVIYIGGTADLRADLAQHLETDNELLSKTRYFCYEEHQMYTTRQSELLQQYAQEHGGLPAGNEEFL